MANEQMLLWLHDIERTEPLIAWIVKDNQPNTEVSQGIGLGDEFITQLDRVSQIIAVVPGNYIYLTKVNLPKLSYNRMLQALPFALEDELVDDAANLHFARSEHKINNEFAVAVVAKQRMQAWQQFLRLILAEHYLKLIKIIPDMLLVPWQDNHCSIVITQDTAWVRTGINAGFSCGLSELISVLDLMGQETKKNTWQHLQLYTVVDSESKAIEEFAQTHNLTYVIYPVREIFSFFANQIPDPEVINLMQGEFVSNHNKITKRHLVTIGVTMLAAWLVIVSGLEIARYLILNRELTAINQELAQVYKIFYPNAKTIPPHPLQIIKTELTSLQAGRMHGLFYRLLHGLGDSMRDAQIANLAVRNLNYRRNELQVELEVGDANAVQILQQALIKRGFVVVAGNAERSSEGIILTRINISEKK